MEKGGKLPPKTKATKGNTKINFKTSIKFCIVISSVKKSFCGEENWRT